MADEDTEIITLSSDDESKPSPKVAVQKTCSRLKVVNTAAMPNKGVQIIKSNKYIQPTMQSRNVLPKQTVIYRNGPGIVMVPGNKNRNIIQKGTRPGNNNFHPKSTSSSPQQYLKSVPASSKLVVSSQNFRNGKSVPGVQYVNKVANNNSIITNAFTNAAMRSKPGSAKVIIPSAVSITKPRTEFNGAPNGGRPQKKSNLPLSVLSSLQKNGISITNVDESDSQPVVQHSQPVSQVYLNNIKHSLQRNNTHIAVVPENRKMVPVGSTVVKSNSLCQATVKVNKRKLSDTDMVNQNKFLGVKKPAISPQNASYGYNKIVPSNIAAKRTFIATNTSRGPSNVVQFQKRYSAPQKPILNSESSLRLQPKVDSSKSNPSLPKRGLTIIPVQSSTKISKEVVLTPVSQSSSQQKPLNAIRTPFDKGAQESSRKITIPSNLTVTSKVPHKASPNVCQQIKNVKIPPLPSTLLIKSATQLDKNVNNRPFSPALAAKPASQQNKIINNVSLPPGVVIKPASQQNKTFNNTPLPPGVTMKPVSQKNNVNNPLHPPTVVVKPQQSSQRTVKTKVDVSDRNTLLSLLALCKDGETAKSRNATESRAKSEKTVMPKSNIPCIETIKLKDVPSKIMNWPKLVILLQRIDSVEMIDISKETPIMHKPIIKEVFSAKSSSEHAVNYVTSKGTESLSQVHSKIGKLKSVIALPFTENLWHEYAGGISQRKEQTVTHNVGAWKGDISVNIKDTNDTILGLDENYLTSLPWDNVNYTTSPEGLPQDRCTSPSDAVAMEGDSPGKVVENILKKIVCTVSSSKETTSHNESEFSTIKTLLDDIVTSVENEVSKQSCLETCNLMVNAVASSIDNSRFPVSTEHCNNDQIPRFSAYEKLLEIDGSISPNILASENISQQMYCEPVPDDSSSSYEDLAVGINKACEDTVDDSSNISRMCEDAVEDSSSSNKMCEDAVEDSSSIDKVCEDTVGDSSTIDKVCEDTVEDSLSINKECEDTVEDASSIDKLCEDTIEDSSSINKVCEDTVEDSSSINKECEDTVEDSSSINKECEDTVEDSSSINKECEDAVEDSSIINKECEDAVEDSLSINKECEDTIEDCSNSLIFSEEVSREACNVEDNVANDECDEVTQLSDTFENLSKKLSIEIPLNTNTDPEDTLSHGILISEVCSVNTSSDISKTEDDIEDVVRDCLHDMLCQLDPTFTNEPVEMEWDLSHAPKEDASSFVFQCEEEESLLEGRSSPSLDKDLNSGVDYNSSASKTSSDKDQNSNGGVEIITGDTTLMEKEPGSRDFLTCPEFEDSSCDNVISLERNNKEPVSAESRPCVTFCSLAQKDSRLSNKCSYALSEDDEGSILLSQKTQENGKSIEILTASTSPPPSITSIIPTLSPPKKRELIVAATNKQNELLCLGCKLLKEDNSLPAIVKVWGEKFVTLSEDQKLFAEKAINDILFEAKLGNLYKRFSKNQ